MGLKRMSEAFDDVIREYIDFVNGQVGVYMDACAGFTGNRVRTERQVHRTGYRVYDPSQQVFVWTSYEDPTKPDVIHNRIIRANDYVAANSEGGFNEQQHARAVLVFLFTYWEDEIRPRLARSKRVELDAISSDIMGDLRVLRHAILHAKSILRADEHKRLKKLKDRFIVDQPIHISYENMHHIFVLIKQGLAEMLIEWLGVQDAPFEVEEIVDCAIQKSTRKERGGA